MTNICVVLNYNDADETIKFCNNFSTYKCIDKILIVDNCSTDDSVQRLKSIESNKILLLKSRENNGYSAGNNVGIKYIMKNYESANIIISNPDVFVLENDLHKILQALEQPDIGMATGLIYTNDKVVSNYAWRLPSMKELILHNFFTLHRILKNTKYNFYFREDSFSQKNIYCDCVPGCFFCIRLDVIRKIGLLDERTFLFGEENILGWKINNSLYKTVVITESKVNHFGGHSIKKSRTKKKTTRQYAEASLQLYIKEYLKCTKFQQKVFHNLFWLAQLEQDLVLSLRRFVKK